MKTTLKMIVLLLAIGMTGCKKDGESAAPKGELIGVWHVREYLEKETPPSGAPTTDRETYARNELTLDFRADGTVVIDGDAEPWRRLSDSRIEIDGLEYDIRELTAVRLVLYATETDDGIRYEATLTCER